MFSKRASISSWFTFVVILIFVVSVLVGYVAGIIWKETMVFIWAHHRETVASENEIPSPPAHPRDYNDMVTARHYFIYEGFSPIWIYFKLIGRLSLAHTKGRFIWMGNDLHSVYSNLVAPLSGQGRPVQKVILKNHLNASRCLIAAESESFCFVGKVVKERMNYDFLKSSEVILSAL